MEALRATLTAFITKMLIPLPSSPPPTQMTDQVPEDDGVEIQEVLVGQAQVTLVVQNILQLLPQHQGTEVWEPQRFCRALTPVDTTQHVCYMLHTASGD